MTDTKTPEYLSVSIPRKVGFGKNQFDAAEFFERDDGKEMACIALPQGMHLNDVNGRPLNASYGRIFVPKSAIKLFDNDPSYMSVSFPNTNKDGEPWQINIRCNVRAQNPETGKWENVKSPEGQYKTYDVAVTSNEFASACENVRTKRREAWEKSQNTDEPAPGDHDDAVEQDSPEMEISEESLAELLEIAQDASDSQSQDSHEKDEITMDDGVTL